MKQLVLAFLFLFVFNASRAQTNSYLQNNPEWTVLRGFSAWYPCIEYDSAHYFLNGDSLYNSNQWKVLWRCGHKWYTWNSPNPNMSCNGNFTYCDTMPTGLIRSQGKQMYFVFWNDTTELLLYDFNMTVGNQPPVTFTYCCPGSETITMIDSFYTPNGYMKRFYVNGNTWQPDFIEGVGSRYGLIEPYGPMLDQFYQLICYGLNDSAWFPSQGPYCDVITNTAAPLPAEVKLQLIPNPANEYVSISATGADVESVAILDVFGRTVKSAQNSEIYVGDLPAGMYYCVITCGEKQFNIKLIIQ